MATQLTPAEIAAGQPTKEELFTKIRDNQIEFESNIASLQSGASKTQIFNLAYTGYMDDYDITDLNERTAVFSAPNGFEIVQFKISLLSASVSGTLGVIIEKSTDDGANWTSIMTSTLQLTGTTAGSVSGVPSFSNDAVNQGDLLRLTFQSQQVDQGDFKITVYGEAL